MRLGLIVESGPQGADLQVLSHMADQIVPGVAISPATFRNKPDLIANCGTAAVRLLGEPCDRVLVVWDLYPAWREDGSRPNCMHDCRSIRQSLVSAGIRDGDARVALICIREELEAWLISDGRALSSVLSRPTHRVRISDTKRPDTARDPKTQLRRLFQRNGHHDYADRTHAIQIARAMPDHTRVRKSQSFRRLVTKLRGQRGARA